MITRVAIGDSILEGVREPLEAHKVEVIAKVGQNVEWGIARAREVRATLQRSDRVLVMLGTNHGITEHQLEMLMGATMPAHTWLTTIRGVSWAARTNKEIRAMVARSSRASLVDWAMLSAKNDWWFHDDGYHPNEHGRPRFAHLCKLALGLT
jgi:lysophospholipase L1-like esterase